MFKARATSRYCWALEQPLLRLPDMSRRRLTSGVLAGVAAWAISCAPAVRSTVIGPLEPSRLAEFWEDVDPRTRDLFHGVAGREVQPDPKAVYTVKATDTTGFSISYDVEDESGVEWSVKMGDEAQSEVTASRIVWAMGYQQPPNAYLARWHWREGEARRLENGGRFRPKLPTLKNAGIWAWHENPFVGTQAYRGLLVLMMILNSTDLKDDNNAVYERRRNDRLIGRWYAVKDLGATLGTTGRIDPKRNDIGAFEPHGFISGVRGGRVTFAFRGRHQELLRVITTGDVAWMCNRLARLTPAQWRDAFRAGGYDEALAARFIGRIQQKIAEGQALQPRAGGRTS
jgi:hypothetical protein